jgi:hypothetical protein
VTSYSQSQYFGGSLTIERPSGELVNAWFGERTTLRCYFVRGGVVIEHSACPKTRLVAGTPLALATHERNASGEDIWTTVELIVRDA